MPKRTHSIALALLCLPMPASAAVLLTAAEQAALRRLVAGDADAKARFVELHATADAAMDAAPNPIAQIVSEGRLRADPQRVRTYESLADLPKIEALAYAFAVAGDDRYAGQARRFLTAWAGVNRSAGNPINDTKLDPAIRAYDLVRATCDAGQRTQIDAWLRQVAEAEIASGEGPKVHRSNWHSHRLKTIGLIGLVLQDETLARHAIDGVRAHIDINLDPDGGGFDFRERDALHYHLYTLDPMLTLAIAARRIDPGLYDYVSPRGSSLRKSVAFLLPYCDGRKTHAEFANSKIAFDRKRAESGDKSYAVGHAFEPKKAEKVLTLASVFEPELTKPATEVTPEPRPKYRTWQAVVVAAMSVR